MTDKTNMELEAEEDGYLIAILKEAGETVPVTEVIGYLGAEGEKAPTGGVSETKSEEAPKVEEEPKEVKETPKPEAPAKPATPTETPKTPVTYTPSETPKAPVTYQAPALPQTGEVETGLAVTAGIATLFSAVALAGVKRKA